MKVRIMYSVDVGDDIRESINRWYGQPGLASRQDVRDWYRTYGTAMDDDLMYMADNNWGDDDGTQEGE